MRSMVRTAALALALAGVLAMAPAASAAVKIGVVDVVEVMNSYERTQDASQDLKVDQANLKAASEPKIQKVEELRLQRDGFNQGTEEWLQLDEKAMKAEIEFRTWLALEQAKIDRRHQQILREMYGEIQDMTAEVAKAQSLDIVFTKAFLDSPRTDLGLSKSLEDMKARITGQFLVYPTQFPDLTQEVLKRLNAAYKAAKGDQPRG